MREPVAEPTDEIAATLGDRRMEEAPPSIRSEAQRDRDRVLYSSAFLRLGHVTQVASPEAGYIFHSRLTHTIKVGQVARGLAQRLKVQGARGELQQAAARLVELLDEDATEAAALAHDLGHPPFGHLAEGVLQMMATAPFEGNPQSFRIVSALALRTNRRTEEGAPLGLNLTRRTMKGSSSIRGREKRWRAAKRSGASTPTVTKKSLRMDAAGLPLWGSNARGAPHELG